MQGTLTRELLGSLWREEISLGEGSFILKGIQHVKAGKESSKLFPDSSNFELNTEISSESSLDCSFDLSFSKII